MAVSNAAGSIYDRLFVLDLDRCLITDKAYALLDDVILESGVVDLQLFQEARQKREASGGTFDSIGWLSTHGGLDEHLHKELLDQYIAKAKQLDEDALLAPGARALITNLTQCSIPHLIMTYGGVAHQEAKIKAAGLEDVPYIIVGHKNKALSTNEWWDESAGLYITKLGDHIIQARMVVLIDDKAAAFTGLLPPPLARGYWVQSIHLLPSQAGEVPENVTPVKKLEDIIEYEALDA